MAMVQPGLISIVKIIAAKQTQTELQFAEIMVASGVSIYGLVLPEVSKIDQRITLIICWI